jgi:hypothetical protein
MNQRSCPTCSPPDFGRRAAPSWTTSTAMTFLLDTEQKGTFVRSRLPDAGLPLGS